MGTPAYPLRLVPQGPTVYHVSPWRRAWIWLVFGPIVLLLAGLALVADGTERGPLLVIALALTLLASGLDWMVRRARLRISKDGVRLDQIGYRLETSWSDIAALRLERGHEGMITVHALQGRGARVLAAGAQVAPYSGTDFYDGVQHALLDEHRFIPIEAFAWHLRHGPMRAQIERFAPHLRADLAALDVPPPATSPAQRRRNWLALGIIVASMAVGFALIGAGDLAQAWFFTSAYALIYPFLALAAGVNAWQLLHRKHWLLGVLMALMTLVMVGWTMVEWGRLGQLFA